MSARADEGGWLTCPSAPPEPGSVLLGIVAAKGEIAYITPNILSRRKCWIRVSQTAAGEP